MVDKKLNETTLIVGATTNDDGVGGINMNAQVLPNMADPVVAQDGATKAYVDASVEGDVTGAASSTVSEIPKYDDATGKSLGNTSMLGNPIAGVGLDMTGVAEGIRLNRVSQANEGTLPTGLSGLIWYNTVMNDIRFSDATSFRYASMTNGLLVVRKIEDFAPFVSGSDITLPDNLNVLVEATINMNGFTIVCETNVSFFGYLPFSCGLIKTADASAIIEFSTVSSSVTFVDGLLLLNLTASGVTYVIDSPLGLFVFNRCGIPGGDAVISDFLGITYILSDLGNSMQRWESTPTNGSAIIVTNVISSPATVTGTFAIAPNVAVKTFIMADYNVFSNIGTNKVIALENASTSIVEFGTIDNARINGTDPFGNFDETSDEWKLKDVFVNDVSVNSFDKGYTEVDNVGVYETISIVQDVFSSLFTLGNSWTIIESEKFSLTEADDGQLTYNGVVKKTYKFTALFDCERGGTADVRYEFAIAINNSIQASSKIDFFADSANPFTITAPVFVFELSPGDTIEWQVTNRTNSDDLGIAYGRHGVYE